MITIDQTQVVKLLAQTGLGKVVPQTFGKKKENIVVFWSLIYDPGSNSLLVFSS